VRPVTIRLLSVRRSLPLFLAIVVCLAMWQVWLTWRLMEQDHNLAAQHSRERLEQIADLAIAQLSSTLGEWDLSLRELDALPLSAALKAKLPPNATLVLLAHQSVAAYPAKSLLFVPEPPAAGPLPKGFETAEKLEFRDQNYERAIEALWPLTEQSATRAEALLRIARLERRLNHPEAALAAYDRMSRETAISPDGVPYALLAAGARCELHDAVEAAEQLRAALLAGRWPLHRATFDYYWSEVNRTRHTADDPPKDSLEFSELVSRLHEQWQQAVRTGANSSGRQAQPDASLLIWYATPERLTALAAPAGWLGASLKLPANASDIRWRFAASGSRPAGEPHVLRSLAEAQLSGKLAFYSTAAVWCWRERTPCIAASAGNCAWRSFRRISFPPFPTNSAHRSPPSAASPNCWRTTVWPTNPASAKATRFWSARRAACNVWWRTFWISGAWNPGASSTASRRTTCLA